MGIHGNLNEAYNDNCIRGAASSALKVILDEISGIEESIYRLNVNGRNFSVRALSSSANMNEHNPAV